MNRKKSLRIALAQINTTVGDFDGNIHKILDYIEQATRFNADIIAFPELAVCGYPPEDLLLKEHFVRDNLEALKLVIQNTPDITAIVGFVDMDKKKNLYNAAAVIRKGNLKGVYHKMHLPNYGVFDEKRYFTPGAKNSIFVHGKTLLGISICEDIWRDSGPQREQAGAGAKILLNISASPYHAGKIKEREDMLKSRARENKAYVFYVNLVCGQDELVFDGGSLVFDSKGKLIARARQFEEELVIVDVGGAPRRNVGVPLQTRRRAPAAVIVSREETVKPKPPLQKQTSGHLSEAEEIYKALVLGTHDYIRKNGFQKAVIGLSGGIDSAITAVIACDAIGKDNVVGVSMPSRFSSQGTRADAKRLAENLGIRYIEIPIDQVLDAYLRVLEEEFLGVKRDITEENIQARIRGNILMALSNKFGWLVLTTGNKSEIAVGYCTLYGDMAGGFAVIKDVFKTKIYDIARFRNSQESKELIPESVFTRAPTAELRENQKDEDSLPAYAVLDPILEQYVELDKSASAIMKKNNSRIIRDVIRLVDKSEYKRRQAPPGVKITPRAFGKDRRLPITNRYREY